MMMGWIFPTEAWRDLLKSDFNRGYLCALALLAALLFIMMMMKLVWWLIFRERSCSRLTISRSDGDIIVSRNALCSAVENELRAVPALKVRKIRIFQHGNGYSITLLAGFDGSGNVSEQIDKVKPLVTKTLRDIFGVENVRRVKVVIENLERHEKAWRRRTAAANYGTAEEDESTGGDDAPASGESAETPPMSNDDLDPGL